MASLENYAFFHTFDWHEIDDPDDGLHYIENYSLNRDSLPSLLRFRYDPYFYILVDGYSGKWTEPKLKALITQLREKRREGWKAYLDDSEYTKCKTVFCRTYRRYLEGKKLCLLVRFKSKEALQAAKSRIHEKTIRFQGQQLVLEVCESEIESVRQFTVERKLKYCYWFAVEKKKLTEITKDKDKISRFKKEYTCQWDNIGPCPKQFKAEVSTWRVYPRILAYDDECFATTETEFPSAYRPTNPVDMISMAYQVHAKPETKRLICLVVGDAANPKPETYQRLGIDKFDVDAYKKIEVYRYNTELEMLTDFFHWMDVLDADILAGHYNLGFDDEYNKQRFENLWLQLPEAGSRIKGRRPTFHDESWGSSGTGKMMVKWIRFPGRITFDTKHIAKLNITRPLPIYTLDMVASSYLGRTKREMGHERIHNILKRFKLISKRVEACIKSVDKNGQPIPHDNVDPKVWEALTGEYTESIEEMGVLVDYCSEDSNLVVDLLEKLNVWINSSQSANVIQVRAKNVYTKGQTYKSMSQIYAELKKKTKEDPEGVVLDPLKGEIDDSSYEGALNMGTIYQRIGLSRDAASLDVNSMYPSIILKGNLCLSSLIPPKLKHLYTPDQYDVYVWTDKISGTNYDLAFLKKEVHHGFLPRRIGKLVAKRGIMKKNMEKEKEGSFLHMACNSNQNALKISANSMYGILVRIGAKELGALVTKIGRDTDMAMAKFIEHGGDPKKPPVLPPGKIIYGDSVVGDTPILVRRKGPGDQGQYLRIKDIPHQAGWIQVLEKEYAVPEDDLEVWSDKGFTPVKSIMRHNTKKNIYRVVTKSGMVDVTEDHSLLDFRSNKISPKDVKDDTILLHAELPPSDSASSASKPQWSDYIYEDKLEAAMAFWDFQKLGCQILLSSRPDMGENCGLRLFETGALMPGRDPWELNGIWNLGPCNDYVYDLETENHHFAAGIGELVVHNTDSIQFTIEDPSMSTIARIKLAKRYIEEINKYIAPLKVVLEKFGDLCVITAKKYIYHFRDIEENKDGVPNPEYGKFVGKGKNAYKYTGVEYVKRNYPSILKRLFKTITEYIMSEDLASLKPPIPTGLPIEDEEKERLQRVIDECFREVYLLVHDRNELKDYIAYESYNGANGRLGPLGINMAKAGKPIQPGERVGYLVVKFPGSDKLAAAEKYRLIDAIGKGERVDVDYYLDRITNPVDRLVNARYHNTEIYKSWFQKRDAAKKIIRILKQRKILRFPIETRPDEELLTYIIDRDAPASTVSEGLRAITSFTELISYRETDEYKEGVDRGTKAALTKRIGIALETGLTLALPTPTIIENITQAHSLGLLDQYAQIMMSPAAFKSLQS